MSQNMASKRQRDQSEESWWDFGWNSWFLIGGLLLFNIGCFLQPNLFDVIVSGVFNLFDFRTWPWWYFLCLIAVLGFSIRWFLLYQAHANDDLDPQGIEEAKWFCRLTGTVTALLAFLVVLHRASLLRRIYTTLNYMFGYGAFSFWALLIFAVIFAIIGLLAFLIWKWIASIQVD